MRLSNKQKEFWNNADSRWNIKSGATRSGKTYLDYYVIPKRIRAVKGRDGLVVILGNTKGTLQRNIIEPLQKIYTTSLVSDIRSDNTAMLFGEKCYCLGADKINQVNRIRGASIKYCYGDEVVTWHEDVFNMLKSRLDKSYSKFDGTCNPDNPNHWFYKFINSNADIYLQEYTIDDNPFLSSFFVENLKKEYEGTVLYDRYILGRWALAEGLIFRQFADNPQKWIRKDKSENLKMIMIGVDFGGNKSKTTFVATGFVGNYEKLIVVDDYKIPGEKGTIDPKAVESEFVNFIRRVQNAYPKTKVVAAWCDNEAQTLINGLRGAVLRNGLGVTVADCAKCEITDRIYTLSALINSGRFEIMDHCHNVINSLKTQVWDDKKEKDVRLDNGTVDIDTADALEYSFSKFLNVFAIKTR